ncbi:MAG: GNAT family N-acetyltransferase, partial [Rubrobacter sp.]
MEIRNFRESDRAALERMLRLAFGGSEDWSRRYFDAEKNPRLEPERVFVASENGEVRASTTVLPMEVFVDGTPAPMGGIAAVMTDPAYRRRGYARKLIEESLREMRGNGMHLSMRDPFSHAFYRASGWETACDYILYKLSPAKLPASDEQRRICAFREDYTPALKRIFEEKAARHQMCVRRCEGRWRQMLEADGDEYARDNEAVVFEADGAGVEGY